jgi:hypothetical protein
VLSLSSVLEEDSKYRDVLISSGSLNSKITRLMYAKGKRRKEKRIEDLSPCKVEKREAREKKTSRVSSKHDSPKSRWGGKRDREEKKSIQKEAKKVGEIEGTEKIAESNAGLGEALLSLFDPV